MDIPRPERVFRRSARLFVVRLAMLLLVTFGVLTLLTGADWQAAALITALGGIVAGVWYLVTRHLRSGIAVDEEGITLLGGSDPVRIRWVDVTSLSIGETLLVHRSGLVPVRYAIVRGLGSRVIAFGDLTFVDGQELTVGLPTPTAVANVANADVLLAIAAERVEDEKLLGMVDETNEEEASRVAAAGGADDDQGRERARSIGTGLLALMLVLGAKAIAWIVEAVQATPAQISESLGALETLWPWPWAAIGGGLAVVLHGGHLLAARAAGFELSAAHVIPVYGFVKLMSEEQGAQGDRAKVALAGPAVGAVVTLGFAVAAQLTGGRPPLLGAAAVLCALLTLLAVLPVAPLAGGHALAAVARSLPSGRALAVVVGSLALGVAVATATGLHFLALLGVIGLAELAVERASAARSQQLALSRRPDRWSPAALLKLRLLTRPGFPEPTEHRIRDVELDRLEKLARAGRVAPMSPRRMALAFATHLVTAGAMVGVLYWMLAVNPSLRAALAVLS